MNTPARLSWVPSVVLAAVACAGMAVAAEDGPVLYQCDDLGSVEASFGEDNLRLVLPDGSIELPRLRSGSGARYGDAAVEFWIKGDEAMMTRTDGAGEIEHECRVSDGPGDAAGAADGIREIVREAIEAHDLKSVVVAVEIDGKPVLSQAWGESMSGVPATPDMVFRNGAIAIAYLTTVLLQLHDEGEIAVDDPLSNWFPEYPQADRVTLQMLANSTSGYADYVYVLPIYDDVFRQWTPDELVEVGLSQPMKCDPGACFAYAHTNFVILGEVLRAVTGEALDDLIRKRIVEPLGLDATESAATAVMPEPVLHAFTSERGVYENSTYWNPSWTLARGAVMTTNISDALDSVTAFGTGSLLSEEAHRLQLAPLTAGFPPMTSETYYGLGVVVSNSWVMQTPSFAGYSAAVGYLPDRRIAVAVTSTMGPDTPEERITNRLFGQIATYLAPDQPPKLPGR